MAALKITLMKTFISIILIISTSAIVCPPGFDSMPPGQTFGICVIIGCSRSVKDQLCNVDCLQGYTKTSGKMCQVAKCISNSKTNCTACQPGYQLKAQLGVKILRVCVPSNCLSFDQASRQCKICQKGYILDKRGACGLANCLEPSRDQSQCISCRQGYSLTKLEEGLGLCIPKNCQIYSPKTYQCEKCQVAYMLTQNSTCVLGIKNCTQFNQFSGLCYRCQSGFKLMAFRSCIKLSPFCVQYSSDGCTECIYQYRPVNGACQPNFCEQFNPKNNQQCIKCQIGYKINSKKLCQVQNCLIFDQKISRCLSCTGLYNLVTLPSIAVQGYMIQKCVSKFCLKFERKTSLCIQCNPQYTLKNGSCIYTNCNKQNETSCEQCVDGWAKNQRGNCVNYDCVEFASPKSCKSCSFDKRLYKGMCIRDNCIMRDQITKRCLQCSFQYNISPQNDQLCIVPFCNRIDKLTGDCLECYPNFWLDSKNFCQSSNCLSYENKKNMLHPQCSACIQGFEPQNEYCILSRKFCLQYQLETAKCKKCIEKYEISNDGLTCNVIKCKQLQKFSVCKICNLGYSLINYNNGTQNCQVNNCSKFQNNICKQCAQRFSQLSDICIADNCKQFMENTGLCKSCLDGFYLNRTTLTCKREKCLQDKKDSCQKCEDGYFIDINQNSLTRGLCLLYNCQEIKFQKRQQGEFDQQFYPIRCARCKSDYVSMPNQRCYAKDCNKIDEISGICRQCLPGFNISKDGTRCLLARNNQFCPDGSYPSNVGCQAMKAQNCISANPQNTLQCYKCKQNFYLRNGNCLNYVQCAQRNPYIGCTKCKYGFKLNKNQECESSVPNCQILDPKNNQCQECTRGYQIILYPAKTCLKIPNYCINLNPWGNCTQCKMPNRVISEGFCILPTNNCDKYDTESGICSACKTGFFKVSDNKGETNCNKNPTNCDLVSQNGQCIKCADNFINTRGVCYKAIDKCTYYSFQKCTLCQPGYYINSNGMNCKELPKFCDKVILNTDGVCEQCRQRYVNVNGVCVRMIDYCNNYELKTGKCLGCESGYSLTSSKTLCLLGVV